MSDKINFNMLGDKELLNMFKALGDDKTKMRELTIFARKSMKQITETQKQNVLGLPNRTGKDFIMYRDGKKYKTDKEQLADSIGVFAKKNKDKLVTGFYSGPRLKGAYRRMNKSGFFGLWIEYGTKYKMTGRGKINLQPRPFTNTSNVALATVKAGSDIVSSESKSIQSTIRRFKKKY